jgi:hypothetical protein
MLLKINEQDWNNIKKALNEISMPLSAHQAVANIVNVIETQCKVEDEGNIRTSDS